MAPRNTTPEYRIELCDLDNKGEIISAQEFTTKQAALSYGRDLAAGMSYTRRIGWRGNIAKNGMRSSDNRFHISINKAINGKFY